MTRKDYVIIAAAIAASAVERPTAAMQVQRRHTATCIADALARENPRFDRERFLAACGV